MRSILQKKDGRCYLCMKLHEDNSKKVVQEHHVVFGTANRKLSEKYGLKVYLCLSHHKEGPEAVHRNAEIALELKKEAQRAFKRNFPELDWFEIFRRNYIAEPEMGKRQQENETQKEAHPGFFFLPPEEGVEEQKII